MLPLCAHLQIFRNFTRAAGTVTGRTLQKALAQRVTHRRVVHRKIQSGIPHRMIEKPPNVQTAAERGIDERVSIVESARVLGIVGAEVQHLVRLCSCVSICTFVPVKQVN